MNSNKLLQTVIVIALATLASGCASTQSSTAKPLRVSSSSGPDLNLRDYNVVTIVPFEVISQKVKDPAIGTKFAADIGARLKNDFGYLFEEVRMDSARGVARELLVTGTIKRHEPGSMFGRAMLIGVGAASFEAELVLKDSATQRNLLTAPIDKLWAWGGLAGVSKDIDRMMAESAAAAANTIARAKGWVPSTKGSK
jgi:hypothetical protein